MIKALADRLAEVHLYNFCTHFVTNSLQAFAEALHEIVRKDYWGYNQEEHLSSDDLLQIKYQVCIIF